MLLFSSCWFIPPTSSTFEKSNFFLSCPLINRGVQSSFLLLPQQPELFLIKLEIEKPTRLRMHRQKRQAQITDFFSAIFISRVKPVATPPTGLRPFLPSTLFRLSGGRVSDWRREGKREKTATSTRSNPETQNNP